MKTLKFFLAATLVLFFGSLSAQSVSLSGTSTMSSGTGFIITVNNESSTNYVTNVTYNDAASSLSSNISVVSEIYNFTSGYGSGATTFAIAMFAVPGTVATTSTLAFDVTELVEYHEMLLEITNRIYYTITVNPPAAVSGGYVYSGTGPVNVLLSTPLYRMNNSITEKHLYTPSISEMLNLIATNGSHGYKRSVYIATYDQYGNVTDVQSVDAGSGSSSYWIAEDNIGYVYFEQQTGTVPLTRLFHSTTGDHIETADPNEVSYLVSAGWNNEGTQGYVFTSSISGINTPVYRYNSNRGGHFFTADFSELGSNNSTWAYEGVAFYILNRQQ